MFEFFNRSGQTAEAIRVDRNLINERLVAALVDAGLDQESKIYHSIFKMLSDDLDWFFENLDEHDLD